MEAQSKPQAQKKALTPRIRLHHGLSSTIVPLPELSRVRRLSGPGSTDSTSVNSRRTRQRAATTDDLTWKCLRLFATRHDRGRPQSTARIRTKTRTGSDLRPFGSLRRFPTGRPCESLHGRCPRTPPAGAQDRRSRSGTGFRNPCEHCARRECLLVRPSLMCLVQGDSGWSARFRLPHLPGAR
jgi:hypothetical protein